MHRMEGEPNNSEQERIEARKRRQREAVDRYQLRKKLEAQRFVTPKQLEALQADPESCKGVCRNCGQILKDVGSHLSQCPVGPREISEYKAKWGFPRAGNATRSDEKVQRYKRPETSAGIRRVMEAGRAIQLERFQNERREWDAITLRVNGASLKEIAVKLGFGESRKRVRTAVRSVDLPEGKRYQCDRGQPFTRGFGVELYATLNLARPDFALLVSTPEHPVREQRIVIWYTNRKKNLMPIEARACIGLRDKIAYRLLGQDGKRGRDSYDRRKVLAALFPRFHDEYKTLGQSLRAIGAFLEKNHEANESDIGAFVIERAKEELRGDVDTNHWRALIRWLPERPSEWKQASKDRFPPLMAAIIAHRAAITGTKNPHRAAIEIQADTMGVPAKILRDAIEEQIEAASPEKMRYILRSFPEFAQPDPATRPEAGEKKTRDPGRPRGMTPERIEEAKKLLKLIAEDGKRGAQKRAAKKVYSGIGEDLAVDRAEKTLRDYRNPQKIRKPTKTS
jgi:hypothetical protein